MIHFVLSQLEMWANNTKSATFADFYRMLPTDFLFQKKLLNKNCAGATSTIMKLWVPIASFTSRGDFYFLSVTKNVLLPVSITHEEWT